MLDLTLSGAFYNNNVGAVALVFYQAGNMLPINPPSVTENPYTKSDVFAEQISLASGTYTLDVLGGTDGEFTLAISGSGFTLDHPCPAQYGTSINDSFQITVA
jgi:hypothetical protein